MRIIITMYKLSYVEGVMEDICKKYPDAVRKYRRMGNTIEFVNGDILKGYSVNSQMNGVRADVAIGLNAEYFTCGSKEDNPVWDMGQLYKYIADLGLPEAGK